VKVYVITSQDRWGEENRVVAAFSDEASADAFARTETARTHALAEADHDLTQARLYFMTELNVDSPETEPRGKGYAAPQLTDAVKTNPYVGDRMLSPREGG
jgi:hypothetical protein